MFQDDLVTDSSRDPIAGGSPEDQARLDAAMRRADELLVTSLKSEERQRNRRRILLFSLGGVAMLAILGALLIAFTAETEQAGRLVQEGGNLFNQQKFVEAGEQFQQAVKLDPKNISAWNGLGWSQFNTGKYSDAEESFKKVLKIAPKYSAALNGLGQLYLLQRRYDDAEKYLLKAAPEASAAWYELARLYLLEGKWDDAAKWAKKVVASGEADKTAKQMLKAAQEKNLPDELRQQLEPPSPAATSSGGNVQTAWQMMNQGRREEAKAILDDLMEKSPKDAAVLNAMGWYYLLASDFDQAKPYFEKCLDIDPLSAGALNGLARILKTNDDLDGAIKLWQKMVDKLPGPNAGTFGLADAYMEKEEYAKAIPLLEQLLKEKPDDHALKEKLRHAREMASKPAAINTENSEELSLQGWRLFQSRQYRDAIGKFNEAIEANPDNCYAWNGLGWSHLNRGNKGAAEKALKKAVSLQPNFSGAQTGLGQIYLEQRKYDLAQKYFGQAAESPGATTAFRGLATISLLAGHFEEAEKWAQALVDAGGPDADATARAMLKAAQEKKLSDGLRRQLEPPMVRPTEGKSSDGPVSSGVDSGASSSDGASENDRWSKRLALLNDQDWRAAFSMGQELASLPPDTGFNILKQNWAKISNVDARQQMLKAWQMGGPYPLKNRNHSRLVDVLDLGMRDPSPEVQKWAMNYLQGVAFQDFSEDFAAYKTWYEWARGKPLAEVIDISAKKTVAQAVADDKTDRKKLVALLSQPSMYYAFDVPAARTAAIEAGLPKLLETWLEAGSQANADADSLAAAEQALRTLNRMKMSPEYLRRVVVPMLAKDVPGKIRRDAVQSLNGKENSWAVDLLIEMLRDCVSLEKPDFRDTAWSVAGVLGDMGDPKPVPTMIAVIDADNTYDTVYGVGYFGLGRLTGVKYDESHDGKWWREWWAKNKQRFPSEVQAMEIPHLAKSSR